MEGQEKALKRRCKVKERQRLTASGGAKSMLTRPANHPARGSAHNDWLQEGRCTTQIETTLLPDRVV